MPFFFLWINVLSFYLRNENKLYSIEINTTVVPTVFLRDVDVFFSLILPESGRAVGRVELRRLHGLCTERHLRHDRPSWFRFPGKAAVA
jgi:hypothetical protein